MFAHGRETVSTRCLETPAHQAALSRLHHLQSRVEFMSAGSAADDIRLNHEFVGSDAHASTIRASGEVDFLIVDGFILRAAQAIDGFAIEEPRSPLAIHGGQDHVVVVDVVLDVFRIRESILDQLSAYRLVESVTCDHRLRGTHQSPPWDQGLIWLGALYYTTPE